MNRKMNTDVTIAPADADYRESAQGSRGKYRQARRAVLAYVVVGLAACAASISIIVYLSATAGSARAATHAIQDLQHQVDRVGRLEAEFDGWKFKAPDFSILSKSRLRSLDGAIDRLSAYDHATPSIGTVLRLSRSYRDGLDQEFGALNRGDVASAKKADREIVDPSYGELSTALSRAETEMDDRSANARSLADALTPAFLIAAVLFALLGAVGQTRGQLARALGEQRTRLQAASAQEIANAHEQVTAILSNLEVSIWSAAADGSRIEYLSAGHEQLYGRPAEEFYANPGLWKEVIHPEDAEGLEENIDAQIRETGEAITEYRIVRPSGEIRWAAGHIKAVTDAEGRIVRLNGSAKDITDEKLVELTLKESERRFQRAIANVPGVLYQFRVTSDGAYSFPYMSSRCQEVFGISAEAVIADASLLMGRIDPGDLEGLPPLIVQSATNLSQFRWECRFKIASGDEHWFRVTSRPEAADDGSVVWDGIIVDITDEKNAELFAREKEAAERANLAKSEFLSRMSHELRTPLNAILGFGQVLTVELDDHPTKEMVDFIVKGGRHLLTLINEVLDISRIESRTIQVSCEPVEVLGLCNEVCDLLVPMAAARTVSITPTQSADRELYVNADVQRLRQVLLNLVSNAIKYNRAGGKVSISVSPAEGGPVRISVADTGRGIPDNLKPRLFSPFDRIGAEQSGVEGTGLGLALSKKLAEVMGGKITMADAPGGGSIFTVELQPASAPTAQADTETINFTPTPKQSIVLYIEDNFSSVRLMEWIARKTGIVLHTSSQGLLGFEEAKSLQPDVIFLDLDLPDIQGTEVLRMLKACGETKHIPIIIASADASSSRMERALEAGAERYITKPIEVLDVMEVLRRFGVNVRLAA
ncbi:MAG TPA: ATP-binding protein [Fimbriimonadaceae bacterium]|nr:ATP-binding protein [Fimbriimonadaceae bacterium]